MSENKCEWCGYEDPVGGVTLHQYNAFAFCTMYVGEAPPTLPKKEKYLCQLCREKNCPAMDGMGITQYINYAVNALRRDILPRPCGWIEQHKPTTSTIQEATRKVDAGGLKVPEVGPGTFTLGTMSQVNEPDCGEPSYTFGPNAKRRRPDGGYIVPDSYIDALKNRDDKPDCDEPIIR